MAAGRDQVDKNKVDKNKVEKAIHRDQVDQWLQAIRRDQVDKNKVEKAVPKDQVEKAGNSEKDEVEKAAQTTVKWLERLEPVLKPKHTQRLVGLVCDLWDSLDDQSDFAGKGEYEARLKKYQTMVTNILGQEYILLYLHNDDLAFMKQNFNYMGGCECRFCRPWRHHCQIGDLFHGCDCVPWSDLHVGWVSESEEAMLSQPASDMQDDDLFHGCDCMPASDLQDD